MINNTQDPHSDKGFIINKDKDNTEQPPNPNFSELRDHMTQSTGNTAEDVIGKE